MTNTEVAVYTQPAASDLEQWARDLTTAYQAARQLVTTSFVPKTYNGKPEEAAAAIITGQELGLSPLAALRSIDIIGGVPAMRAIAMRALVQSIGHEIWTEESTRTQAIVAGRRKGSDKVERSVWTIDRARELGLLGKDNWKKQPIAMLLARSTSELVRLIAADTLLGIPYSVEEVLDLGDVESEASSTKDAPRQASSRRTAKRAPLDPMRGEAPALPDEQPAIEAGADESTGEIRDDDTGPIEVVRAAVEESKVADLERDEDAIAEAARRAFEDERMVVPGEDPWEPLPDGQG